MEIGVLGYWIISIIVFLYLLGSALTLTFIIIRQGIGATRDVLAEEDVSAAGKSDADRGN
jgi:hypothetical protein